jgi:hypothetical protein
MNQLSPAAIVIGGGVAVVVFLVLFITGATAFHLGFKEGWTVGSACTVAAHPADAGNVSSGVSACAPP